MKKLVSLTIAGALVLTGVVAFMIHTVGQCCCSGLAGYGQSGKSDKTIVELFDNFS